MRPSPVLLSLLALPVLVAHVMALSRPGPVADGAVRERVLALVNAGQQISAAQAIHNLRSGAAATDLGALVEKGNLQVPAPGSLDDGARLASWRTDGRTAFVSLDGDVRGLCAEVARQASGSRSGGTGTSGDQFGCEPTGAGARFVFRVQ